MRVTQSTWSPFQSAEVREICAHFTPAEHARFVTEARQRGVDMRRWIVIPFGITAVLFAFSWQIGLALAVIGAIYSAISVWPRLRAMRRKRMEMLCDTEWAYNRGCTPERLHMLKFPWSR